MSINYRERTQFLTHPSFRVNGKFKTKIDQFAGTSEPVLDRLAYYNSMDDTTFMLYQNWPLYRNHEKIKGNITQQVKEAAAKALFDLDLKAIDQKINEYFSEKKLNNQLFTKQQFEAEKEEKIEKFLFSKQLPKSFLPHIIKLAKDNDIKLAFIRIKRRRDLEPEEEKEQLKHYIQDLTSYLQKEDYPLIDFTYDHSIQEKHYGTGDHLNRSSGRTLFTTLVSQALSNYL